MKRVVVDASVAVKWLLPLPQNEAYYRKAKDYGQILLLQDFVS